MMDARTREALEASIKHWQENVAAETPDDVSTGPETCALCAAFQDGAGSLCEECPVRVRTRLIMCQGTPYSRAAIALYDWTRSLRTKDDFREAAEAELNFLISLRPTEGGAA